jgi:nucleotide-binding universal stress UspA family protein
MLPAILFPIEISEGAERLIDAAEEIIIAGVERMTLLHVVRPEEALADPTLIDYDRTVLENWRARLVQCRPATIESRVVIGIPWITIVDTAAREHFSYILVGSHGKGLIRRMYLGSEAETVLHNASVPVFVIRLNIIESGVSRTCSLSNEQVFRRILFAVDFSDDSKKCIPFLDQMAGADPGELILAHIQDTRRLGYASPDMMAEFNRKDAQRLEELKNHFQALGFRRVTTILRTGNAITELLDILRGMDVSLLMMGAKGRTNMTVMTLGGVSQTLVHRSPTHVFVAR